MSQNLTQPQSQSENGNWLSQTESQEKKNPWGRITPTKHIIERLGMAVTSYEICHESFAIGKVSDCQFVMPREIFSEKSWIRISKIHCRLTKDDSDPFNPVFIQDLSTNGTFLNNKLIGFNQKRVLKTGDVIAFGTPKNKVFEFGSSYNESYDLPADIFNRYHVGRLLGSGAQGMVRLVVDRQTCETFAMKEVKMNESGLGQSIELTDKRIKREVHIMKSVRHPNIIQCHEVITKPDSVYMFLELMKGGDLLHRIRSQNYMSVASSKYYFLQLCRAVKYLHDRNITHRDIKPDNILLLGDDERTILKLSDFGLSKLLKDDSLLKTQCGTLSYMSPDKGTTPAETFIKSGKFDFNKDRFSHVPHTSKQLIKQMLKVNPNDRLSIDDVLNHPWLQEEKDKNRRIVYFNNERTAKRRRIEWP